MRKKTVTVKSKLKLKCKYCNKTFYATCYRKYCNPLCRKAANAIMGKIRYDEMRKALLRSRGEIK